MVHFFRNVFTIVPKSMVKVVAAMLKAIHAQEDRETAEVKVIAVVKKISSMRLTQADKLV